MSGHLLRFACLCLFGLLLSTVYGQVQPGQKMPKITAKFFFDIQHGGRDLGRITIGVFGQITPVTVRNFHAITTGRLMGHDMHWGYKGNKFHRVIEKFMIQAGDLTAEGHYSIFGHAFHDETFRLKHTGPGIVSMANKGRNTNGSQFFITTKATRWLDNRHVVFGIVTDGMETVYHIEKVQTDANDKPVEDVIIVDCGELPMGPGDETFVPPPELSEPQNEAPPTVPQPTAVPEPPAHTEVPPMAPPVPPASVPPETLSETPGASLRSGTPEALVIGLFVFGVPIALFLWCGGMRRLRAALTRSGRKEKFYYDRVPEEEIPMSMSH